MPLHVIKWKKLYKEHVNMNKKELAIANHDKKYNCCQSVICAFADEAGEAFGLGMGGVEVVKEVLGL